MRELGARRVGRNQVSDPTTSRTWSSTVDQLVSTMSSIRSDALVQRADLDEVVEDRLGAREAGEPADRGGDRARRGCLAAVVGSPGSGSR